MTAAADLKKTEYNLADDVFRLLREEPFFAAISRCVEKQASYSIPTAGVSITDDGMYKLWYNPDWMHSLPDNHRRGILKHEFYHLLFEHCGGRADYDKNDRKQHKLHNIAYDMAINCHIRQEVPDNGTFAENFGFEQFLSAEQYLDLLNKLVSKKEEAGEGDSTMEGMATTDDHGTWDMDEEGNERDGDGPDGAGGSQMRAAAAAIAKERLREAARKGAEAAARSSRGWGNMHQSVRDMIMRFINGSVDWRAVLRNFIGNAQRANRSNTVKRVNKRFPYIHPGRRVNHTAHIAIAIDQSGSVSDELLGLFFAELNGLAKLATFTVVPFDTSVDDSLVHQWKKGQRFQPERVMRGGTDFDAPTQWVNEHPEIDGLIILTDMEAPAPKACKRRRLWMTDRNGKEHPCFNTDELVVEVRNMNVT